MALATHYDGWKVTEPEALYISAPIARILERHPEWAEKILERSDAAALVLAVVTVTGPRIMLYKEAREAAKRAQIEATTPPPREAPNVHAMNDYRSRETPGGNGKIVPDGVDLDGMKAKLESEQ